MGNSAQPGSASLHVIADPLCGWCFGAAPLVSVSREIPGLQIHLHCGGLFSGPSRRIVDEDMLHFINTHHIRIAQLTGQEPGAGFTALMSTGNALLDSTPPIRGILSSAQAGADPLDYYLAVIKAHFIDGMRVAETAVLANIAEQCGIDPPAFRQAFETLGEDQVMAHVNASRTLLHRVGSAGFPTFVIEREGELQRIDHHSFYHDAAAWRAFLERALAVETPA